MWPKRASASNSTPMNAIGTDGTLTQTNAPTPQKGELLIKVAYAGVNRADLLQRQGLYPAPEGASPILGLEVSGTIAGFGEGAVGWSEGEPVCALVHGGGYAEYVTVHQDMVLPLPPRIGLKEAACIPEAAMTAWMALVEEGRLRDGETVLLHGGASGVGIFMVQLASLLGAKAIATVGNDAKAKLVEECGGTAINHSLNNVPEEIERITEGRGVDVVIDILGGTKFNEHIGMLRHGGRMVSLAFMESNMAESARLSRILTRHLRISGRTLRGMGTEEKAALMEAVRKRMVPYIATGAIRPIIDKIFPLSEMESAHKHMQERLHCGKILLEVAANSA